MDMSDSRLEHRINIILSSLIVLLMSPWLINLLFTFRDNPPYVILGACTNPYISQR
jgi:hypothetical protein